MNFELAHTFQADISGIDLPKEFTCPFFYEPHKLCKLAANQVFAYIEQDDFLRKNASEGKMFGVLVVRTQNDEIRFLSAFSGQIGGRNNIDFFVPPVFDILADKTFFIDEESKISAINKEIQQLETSPELLELQQRSANFCTDQNRKIQHLKDQNRQAKEQRDLVRKNCCEESVLNDLIKESQFQKAELKRAEKQFAEQQELLEEQINQWNRQILECKNRRKEMSAALQRKLFSKFTFFNARGEQKNVCEIFSENGLEMPPAAAGECAAPRLLQYAFSHQMRPIAMAEFWYGRSPKQEIRQHGNFYTACKHKCEPILNFMLQGLQVEANKLLQNVDNKQITKVFEDEWLLVVNKPEGVLSVRGKNSQFSVESWLAENYQSQMYVVHRLDMATSGLLVVAKSAEVYKKMQTQFSSRQVKKRYVALLNGIVAQNSGVIDLPLSPDYTDRPRQIVDFEHGKSAKSLFNVLNRYDGKTLVEFFPLTGRTHQLRVHSAHFQGLNCPIVGDSLYGTSAERLCLHAQRIEFQHPVTSQIIVCETEVLF